MCTEPVVKGSQRVATRTARMYALTERQIGTIARMSNMNYFVAQLTMVDDY